MAVCRYLKYKYPKIIFKSFYFSDLMGDHQLSVAIESQISLTNSDYFLKEKNKMEAFGRKIVIVRKYKYYSKRSC